LLVHAHQYRVLDRILQHLRGFLVVLLEHLQLLAAGDRRAVGARPDHCGAAPCSRSDFCVASARLPTLKMNLPSRSSRLVADWVMLMACPSFSAPSPPPGLRLTKALPSSPPVAIVALLSGGNCTSWRTVNSMTA